MNFALNPGSYDEVVSALTGNGELCTTLSPTGYHVAPEQADDTAHRTQHFVWAGRRQRGPQHPLVNFGTLVRTLTLDGQPPDALHWEQQIETETGAIVSEWRHKSLFETTRSFIALADNLFLADTVLTNTDDTPHEVHFHLTYRFGETAARLEVTPSEEGVTLAYELEDHLGRIDFGAVLVEENGQLVIEAKADGATALLTATLEPGQHLVLTTWLHFSDRMHYEFPITAADVDRVVERHEQGWADFWNRSEVLTGDEIVDSFRTIGLYTLRCQMTPWSIAPTLSHPYWGGGAFHDEMYPFFGLLTSNYPELAERIPYFRLTTLPQAITRARGRGALYPWSSTEFGEERDPNGLWLTERFHLGQFAVCIHALWLYERDRIQLDDLYPVLRELARYFELDMLETEGEGVGGRGSGVGGTTNDERPTTNEGRTHGPHPLSDHAESPLLSSLPARPPTPDPRHPRLRTRACVDFDESVGAVTNGPFTISAAIACMEYAAEAAQLLGRDLERVERWRAPAAELRQNLPAEEGVYAIPDDKPLHYSILGPIFPFRVDVDSPRAIASAAYIHRACRSTMGWKPGYSEVFEGSNWMWTAGHLGIVHAMQGNADPAWEAIRMGPLSAGPFLSPNEHVDGAGVVHVPWFTTGVGGWLYALNALFVQVDEAGTRLLPAVPQSLTDVRFRDLRAESGVLVSGGFQDGRLTRLTALAPRPLAWRYRIPARYAPENGFAGRVVNEREAWLSLEIDLTRDEVTSLLH